MLHDQPFQVLRLLIYNNLLISFKATLLKRYIYFTRYSILL
jgi:hypothetical protein